MELLEEPNGECTSDEGIERVMRSLESEIVGIGSIDHRCQDLEESRLDDILSDLNGEGSRYMMTVEDPFRWVESNMNGDEMFLDGDRMIMYDEDYEGFYYGESSVEQLYIPSWQ